MKINILRAKTEQCPQEILIGEFTDLYHSMMFLKTMLGVSMGAEGKGRYIVEYDCTEEMDGTTDS